MALLENIFAAKQGGFMPDVNLNVRAFDKFSIVKRAYGQIQAAQRDLQRTRVIQYPAPDVPAKVKPKTRMADDLGLSEFKSKISAGLAKPNWFKVFITKPSDLGASRGVSLFAESAEFPSSSVEIATNRIYGYDYRYPVGRAFEPTKITFLVDRKMEIKIFFDIWLDMICGYPNLIEGEERRLENWGDVSFLDDYASNIQLIQLDSGDISKVYSMNLSEAYPTRINAIDLSHKSQNEFHRLEVEFEYKRTSIEAYSSPVFDATQDIPEPSIPKVKGTKTTYSSSTTNDENNPYGSPVREGSLDALFGKAQTVAKTVNSQILGEADRVKQEVTNNIASAVKSGKDFFGFV